MALSFTSTALLIAAVLVFPAPTAAQQTSPLAAAALSAADTSGQQSNVPGQVQRAEEAVERAVERFGIGVFGGVGVDPELIQFGAHARFGPIFNRNVGFRPGIEFGLGELTTMFAINLDVLYTLPGATNQTRWMPYIGAGPNFGLSHRTFSTDELDKVNTEGVVQIDNRGRFDFGDTNFNGGFNFITGARNPGGLFFEMRATAWGVSNVRLLAGFNF